MTDNFPKLVIGTFQYNSQQELQEVVDAAISCGLRGFDTSPSYHTEDMLGNVLQNVTKSFPREELIIQDKIDAWHMEVTKGDVTRYVDESLRKLKTDYIDVLFIHWPFPEYLEETWRTFIKLKDIGKIKYIGLSNVHEKQMELLKNSTDVYPDLIQIERHPLRTCDSDIAFSHRNNILVEAYSPICRMDERISKSSILKEIADKYHKTIGQVIFRWHIDTGVIPVFMTKKAKRINENIDVFDFKLTDEEIQRINSRNENFKIFVESVCCPGL